MKVLYNVVLKPKALCLTPCKNFKTQVASGNCKTSCKYFVKKTVTRYTLLYRSGRSAFIQGERSNMDVFIKMDEVKEITERGYVECAYL